MIRKLVIHNYRLFRAASIELSPFALIAGPSGTGKSAALAALQLIADAVARGACAAIHEQAPCIDDLCFDPARPLSFALELSPLRVGDRTAHARYELQLSHDADHPSRVRILREQLFLVPSPAAFCEPPPLQQSLFETENRDPIAVHDKAPKGWKKVVAKTAEGKDSFWDERTDWHNVFRFGIDRSALGSIPEDADRFPAAVAVRDLLREGILSIRFDPRSARKGVSPIHTPWLNLDGSQLPLLVHQLLASPAREPWLRIVRAACPGLLDVSTPQRDEDRSLSISVTIDTEPVRTLAAAGIPDSWLRCMAIAAALCDPDPRQRVWLIDDIDTGLQPNAVQPLLTAANQPSHHQFVCAAQTPVALGYVGQDQVIVAHRHADGSGSCVRGSDVPSLKQWVETRRNLIELMTISMPDAAESGPDSIPF